jgi:hypothetical protein
MTVEKENNSTLLLLIPVLLIYNSLKSIYGDRHNSVVSQKSTSLSDLGSAAVAENNASTGDPRDLYIRKVHEAGHVVMAELLEIGIKKISLEPMGGSGGRVILDLPGVQMSSELKKLIMINYSGFIAEKIIFGDVSTGSIGSYDSDIERANLAIKHFIVLSDNEISITGYEDEYIKSKSIELSKALLSEATSLMERNKEKLNEKIESL